MIALTILTLVIIQEYICWMTYKNWFDNEITYCKMQDSYSFIAMVLLLPLIVWIPVLPVYAIWYATDKHYLTLKWMF